MKHFLIALASLLFTQYATAQSAVYEVWFFGNGLRHHGLMLTSKTSNNWKMRVQHYHSSCACTRTIEQDLKLTYDNQVGYWLDGYNAKDVRTGRAANDYYADNFFMVTDEKGNTSMKILDDNGTYAEVTISMVAAANVASKKREFGW